MRDIMKESKTKFDRLSVEVNKHLGSLQRVEQRWQDVGQTLSNISAWLKDIREVIQEPIESRGELGEMKTLLEKFKTIEGELQKRQNELKEAKAEAEDLAKMSRDPNVEEAIDDISRSLSQVLDQVRESQALVNGEVSEHQEYQQAMQAAEKWLLQTSFQLMAHNALYINTKEQSQTQLERHEKLMDEIRKYQSELDAVREKGNARIAKYLNVRPEIKPTTEKQHQNFQESYNSLLQTGTQIKNRLLDSIAKFQEYEDALENIVKNLEEMEPKVKSETTKPLEDVDDFQAELETLRVWFTFIKCHHLLHDWLL